MRSVGAPVPAADAARERTVDAGTDAAADAQAADAEQDVDAGPFEVPFAPGRTVYYVASAHHRLLANLHGVCNPPGYACGYWTRAASEEGFLVCPTGNARCGAAAYHAPTWTEPEAKMDDDLEAAIAEVARLHPGGFTRDGAILTGFSKGAYAAARIAVKHPGRWPYLILVEADVSLDAATLRAAGVRAVALVAGEIGSQIAGERRTAAELERRGFPAKLWVMKKAGHWYSADIDEIMREAIAFVVSSPRSP